ncbi:hypothetical protein C6558_22330 [Ensifer sp. NM-2]|nr:hypothetical protein [Ensifer canadensis]PSS62308.1 hypothetical protein C6558_22330 [Ensifer sp. NM-2]
MSRKSVQRFCEGDMHKSKNLKCGKRILEIATRFNTRSAHVREPSPHPRARKNQRTGAAAVARDVRDRAAGPCGP